MKKHFFTISLVLSGMFFAFMLATVVSTKAQESQQDPYDDQKLGLEDVMVEYHKYVNETFNENTKKMLVAKPDDLNGKAFDMTKKPPVPFDDEACEKHPENFSTFCVAARLLGGKSGQKGYLNYKKALEKRRNAVFDTAAEKDAWNKWIETTTCLGVVDSICDKQKEEQINDTYKGIYQAQKIMEVSGRMEAINREISAAKEALDQSLSSYDQLRLAWPMHQQYKNIFNALVDYRDKLIEVRHQTDQFPSRFIDVTTAKCF